VAFCGGAATLYRSITKFLEKSGLRHIFHNSIISSIPSELEEVLKKKSIRIWVSWCEDPDHMRASVAYKWLNSKRKEKN